MTHDRPAVPPAEQWPLLTSPDCPRCACAADVTYLGPATRTPGSDVAEVNVWRCRTCPADFAITITHWPILDGPDCPYCDTSHTCWAALDPDQYGDLWTCQNGHEFTLTPEGLIITPEDADDVEGAG